MINAFLSPEANEERHIAGTSHPDRYNPDTWTDEIAHLSKPGQREIQAALLYDYRTNIYAYPVWQAWLRQYQPPTLVVRGANEPSFIAAGATAFRADLPRAEVHLVDAGHFALDEQNDEIAALILTFMAEHLPQEAPAGDTADPSTSGPIYPNGGMTSKTTSRIKAAWSFDCNA